MKFYLFYLRNRNLFANFIFHSFCYWRTNLYTWVTFQVLYLLNLYWQRKSSKGAILRPQVAKTDNSFVKKRKRRGNILSLNYLLEKSCRWLYRYVLFCLLIFDIRCLIVPIVMFVYFFYMRFKNCFPLLYRIHIRAV